MRTTSIVLMLSVFAVSLILLVNVLKQQNIYLTIAALYICIFNAIVTVGVITQRGKNG